MSAKYHGGSLPLLSWSEALQTYVPVDSSNPVPTSIGTAQEPFSGSANVTHTFARAMRGFVIKNDGAADLTFTVGTATFTVKGGEQFDDTFEAFTQVTVTTAVAFRAYGRA